MPDASFAGVRHAAPGVLGMVMVGGSVGVSGLLTDYPFAMSQSGRYALGAAALVGWSRLRGIRLPRPTRAELPRLAAIAVTGLILFNLFLVVGQRHAEPAVLGVAVGSAPLALAVLVPLADRRRPAGGLIVAAALVVLGVVLVEGSGHVTAAGLLFAAGTLVCEVLFTLLAVPLLPRLGPLGVSVHVCVLAAVLLALCAPLVDGQFRAPTMGELAALGYLAVMVTAVAFLCWYSCVQRIGGDRAGLLCGIVPVSALLTGAAVGTGHVSAPALAGTLVVGAGVLAGLSLSRASGTPAADRG